MWFLRARQEKKSPEEDPKPMKTEVITNKSQSTRRVMYIISKTRITKTIEHIMTTGVEEVAMEVDLARYIFWLLSSQCEAIVDPYS
jgi:hypothetical protein